MIHKMDDMVCEVCGSRSMRLHTDGLLEGYSFDLWECLECGGLVGVELV